MLQNNFKTKAIYNLLTHISNSSPKAKALSKIYLPFFKDIDLSISNYEHNTGEVYIQSLNLVTNEIIYLAWNIDLIIKYIDNNHIPPQLISPFDILHNTAFVLPDLQNTLQNTLSNSHNFFTHKTDYVIFAELPCFTGLTIIDGNHRFCEALIQNDTKIKAYFINPDFAANFLHPESKKFIELLSELITGLSL